MANLSPRVGVVLQTAIEDGVNYGYHRVFKHNDSPSEQEIKDSIAWYVEQSIYEWFEVNDDSKNDPQV